MVVVCYMLDSVAWLIGWALILEYTLGGSAVARGISPNLVWSMILHVETRLLCYLSTVIFWQYVQITLPILLLITSTTVSRFSHTLIPLRRIGWKVSIMF